MDQINIIFLMEFSRWYILLLSRSNGWRGGDVMNKYDITMAEVPSS